MADSETGERKILVAVDESEESVYALQWCLKNVVRDNSKDTLLLLYAKPSRVVYTASDGTGRREYREGIVQFNSTSFSRESVGFNFSNYVFIAGYLFSSDIIATMDKYTKEVADCVIEKAKKICKDLNDVSGV